MMLPLGGGASPISKELAIRMAQRGHHIDVVTMWYPGLPSMENIEGVTVHRVKCIRKKKASCNPLEQLTYVIASKKIIKELMKHNKYDLCHAHFIVPTGLLAKYVKENYGLNYLLTAHGSDVEGHNKKKSNKIIHKCIRPLWQSIVNSSVEVIAPSEYFLSLIRRRNNKIKSLVIPNGIDLIKYRADSLVKKEHRILFCGRLQWTKNVQVLIKAVSQISMNDWKVDIVGDGPYRKELEKMVSEKHLKDVVTFHGWIANGSATHMDFLRRASLFVSQSYFESFGVAVVEAAAMGCSLLISDIEAHRNLIKNENCFVAPDDCAGLAEKISKYISGGIDLSIDRGNIERFDWNTVTGLYEKEYERFSNV